MASRRIHRRGLEYVMNTETFILAWYTDVNDDGKTVFERIIAEVDNTSVMFKKEDGDVIFSKDEDGDTDKEFHVVNSESLNEMSIYDFDTTEIHNFYECLCERNYKNELRA